MSIARVDPSQVARGFPAHKTLTKRAKTVLDAVTPHTTSGLHNFPPTLDSAIVPRIRLFKATRVQIIKGGFGGTMLLAAVYGLASQRAYVASNNAVVSANVASVRVPIDGYVSDLRVDVGATVSKGEVIGYIQVPRTDQQALIDLRQSAQRDLIETDGNMQLRDRLIQERKSLEARDTDFLQASTGHLEELERQGQQQVASKEALKNELRLQLDRDEKLYQQGIVSRAELDRMERQYSVADHDGSAERDALKAAHIAALASGRGILLDSGSNGQSYAQQRIDELDMRLAEVNRMIAESRNEGKLTQQTLADQSSNFEMKRSVKLQSPVDGVVWKLIANDGEEVQKGDKVIQFVDCKSAFVVAAIPQNRVPDIEIGGVARFRLSGETADRYGTVSSVTGERNERTDAALAAAPVHERNPTATVFISQLKSGKSENCIVGRTARVLLPVVHLGLLAELQQYAK